jgi:hypothetical protein
VVFFSVSSTNKTDHDDITEILLKVTLNTINQTALVLVSISVDCCSSTGVLNTTPGADPGGADPGGAHPARAPPKIGKNKIFWRIIVIFHTKYPNIFCASLRNWKKYDFLA